MDRRHWYLVSKLQDSLGLKSAQLEAFLCQEGTFANFQSFVNGETMTLFVWQLAGIERRDTLMPSDFATWDTTASANDGTVPSTSPSTFACDASPPGKFANKCVYLLWTDPRSESQTIAPAASTSSFTSVAPSVSSTFQLAQDLGNDEVFHIDSSMGVPPTANADIPTKSTRAFSDCILTGELEPDLGADLQANFLTTLLPHLSHANWGKASDEDVVAFHGVSWLASHALGMSLSSCCCAYCEML